MPGMKISTLISGPKCIWAAFTRAANHLQVKGVHLSPSRAESILDSRPAPSPRSVVGLSPSHAPRHSLGGLQTYTQRLTAFLAKRDHEVGVVMVGEVHGRQRDAFHDHIRALRLESHVTLASPVSHENGLTRYYQLANAVVFPSQYEQF